MSKLIDTNIIIDALRNKDKPKDYLRTQTTLICSIITAAELIRGSRNKEEQVRIEKVIKDFEVIPLSSTLGEKMLGLTKNYSLSHGLEIPDALIAATAIEENLTLVTSNTKHFSFIKGLKLEDWEKMKVSGV